MQYNEDKTEVSISVHYEDSPKIAKAKELFAQLPHREKLFINAYLEKPVMADAARAIGVSEKTCRVVGSQMHRRPRIKAVLDLLLAEEEIIPLRLTERLRRNAEANLTHFMKKEKRIVIRNVYMNGEEYISKLEREGNELRAFLRTREFTSDEMGFHNARLRQLSDEINMAEIRLDTEPDKLYIVQAPPVLEDHAVIDSARLVGNDDVQVTAISYDKQGNLKIKLAKVEDAQDKLARFGGMYEADNRQKAAVIFNISEDDARLGMEYNDAEDIESEEVE